MDIGGKTTAISLFWDVRNSLVLRDVVGGCARVRCALTVGTVGWCDVPMDTLLFRRFGLPTRRNGRLGWPGWDPNQVNRFGIHATASASMEWSFNANLPIKAFRNSMLPFNFIVRSLQRSSTNTYFSVSQGKLLHWNPAVLSGIPRIVWGTLQH